MLEAKEIIVLSDIHMGPEYDKGLFRADEGLANCLTWILDNKEDCHIVLAGDIFDYLVLGERETTSHFFDVSVLEDRTTNIIEKHPEVFDALSKLAKSRKHSLIMIAGNHDPELVFPQVQQIIEKRLGIPSFERSPAWLVQGEALQVKIGPLRIVIEHGDNFDKYNQVDHAKLLDVLALASRGLDVRVQDFYDAPFGSTLVLEHITPIRGDYPWLDYLQPTDEAVIPLMREFTGLKQKASFLKILEEFAWMTRSDLFKRYRAWRNPPAAYTRAGSEDPYEAWLRYEKDNEDETRGYVFKASDDNLIKELIGRKTDVFNITKHDSSYDDIAFYGGQGSDLVICGHTHIAKIYSVGNGLYINTGTWAQLLETPGKDDPEPVWKDFIDNLRQGAKWKDTSYCQPTFAHVTRDEKAGTTIASLIEWAGDGPLPLAAWNRPDQATHWSKNN